MTSLIDRRRESILRASIALIDDVGVPGVTMASIAEKTGLSRPAIYQYFASREHILGELLINDMADLSNEIDRILAGVSDDMEQVRVWLHYALAHMSSSEHRVVREISASTLPDEQRGELMAMHGYFMMSLISPLQKLGIDDPASLVSMIFAAISASADRIVSGEPFIREAAAVEKFVIAGIEAAL